MTKPLEQLEGKEAGYFRLLAEYLEAGDREAFIGQVAEILNHEPQGTPDTVDPGAETVLLARLLQNYPRINFTSITSRDIQSYSTSDDISESPAIVPSVPVPSITVEQETDRIVRQLMGNSSGDIVFKGTKYTIGQDDLNPLINDALEAEGSKKRICFAGTGEGGTLLIYAEPVHEEKVTILGRKIRLMVMDSLEAVKGIQETMMAVNDQLHEIVVIRDHIRQLVKERQKMPRISRSYQRDVHERIYTRVFKAGNAEELAHRLEPLVLKHEEGHFKLQEKQGFESHLLAMHLENVGDPSLRTLAEVYADLTVVERMVSMAEKDPEAAQSILFEWLVFRGPANPGMPISISDECVLNLLLSAVSGNDLAVDWEALKIKLGSLTRELDAIFSEIMENIKLDMASRVTGVSGASMDVKYKKIKDQLTQLVIKDDPNISFSFFAEMVAAAHLVTFVMNQKDAFGRPLAGVYMGDLLSYQRRIDDWMRNNLGLNDETVPFKAPKVIVIKPEDIPGLLNQGR